MNYYIKRLRQLASLCIEKDITTNHGILIKYSGILGNPSHTFRFVEIEIRRNADEKRRVCFEFYIYSTGEVRFFPGKNNYPIDRIFSFIAGLK